MPQLHFVIDNQEYVVSMGKITGLNYDSRGVLMPVNKDDIRIPYLGSQVRRILPTNKVWNSAFLKAQDGSTITLTIKTTQAYSVSGGLIYSGRTQSYLRGDYLPSPKYTPITLVNVQLSSSLTLFSYIPEFTESYNSLAMVKEIPTGTPTEINVTEIPISYVSDCRFFTLENAGNWKQNKMIAVGHGNALWLSKPIGTIDLESVLYPEWTIFKSLFYGKYGWNLNTINQTTDINWYFNQTNTPYYENNRWPGYVLSGSYRVSDCGKELYQPIAYNAGNIGASLAYNPMISNSDWYRYVWNAEDDTPPDDDVPPPPDAGEKDDTSDEIPVPTPTMPVTKFLSAYIFSQAQLDDLASKLWTQGIFDKILGLTANAFDCLVSLNAYNFAIQSAGTKPVQIGNVTFEMSADYVDNYYQTISMGSLKLTPYFNDYRDYENILLQIYLPFIGIKELPNAFFGKTISIKYIVDLITGELLCTLSVQDVGLNSVVNNYKSRCGYTIPIGSQNYSRLYSDLMSSFINFGISTAYNGGEVSQQGATGLFNRTWNALEKTNTIQTASSLDGNISQAGVLYPYIIMNIYETTNENYYRNFNGYNSYYFKTLSNISGFARCEVSLLKIDKATEQEIDEIKDLLQKGVIF